ncbi:MAG: cupin domain-containing protein [Alphaproteobacteria bacterium]|nr:cupin domain-containing protein [Alphaproteobacteria bacterium]
MDLRRIVTGLTDTGQSTDWIDGPATNAVSRRPGHESRLIWVTDESPARFDGDRDEGARDIGRPPPPNGTIFRVIEIAPGCVAEMHRTDTIDYVVVISGAIEMELETGAVHLNAGDVIVQRGTLHNWVNNGTEPCRVAVVLVDGHR